MRVITARNVNDALVLGLRELDTFGVREESRNGPVKRIPGPVSTVYERPQERVLLLPWRDANPFFHLVEALWMIAGRDTLRDLTPFVKRMKEYSDDGGATQPGAYGKRWRGWFGHVYPSMDQLNWVVKRLRDNPKDRRVVIQMWDPNNDIEATDNNSADVPCNIVALPSVYETADSSLALHLTVFCRSNDIVWGAYGANAVHFSFLLEYLAGRVGLPVGTYTQVSNNYHGYLNTLPAVEHWSHWGRAAPQPYEGNPRAGSTLGMGGPQTYPLFADFVSISDEFRERILQEDLAILFEHGPLESVTKARWPFIRHVAAPMMIAHQRWRLKGPMAERCAAAEEILQQVQADDWRLAGQMWLDRRRYLAENKEADSGQ